MQFEHLRLGAILDYAAENHGDVDVVTLTGNGKRVVHGYAEIRRRARQAADALTCLGLGRGDRIATLAWNSHRHLELYYAIPGMGGVIHTLNPRASIEQLAFMIDSADDKVLLFDSDFGPLVERLLGMIAVRPLLIELGDRSAVPGAHAYEALIDEGSDAFDWVDGDEREPCGLCFTSGTTGAPKGVAYTHRSTVLHAMACCMSEGQAVASTDTLLPVVPMFHANAWGMPHSAPMAGARLVLPGRWLDGASLLDAIDAERVTFLGGVPTIWQSILDAADARGVGLEPLVRAGIGGAAPSREMIERIEAKGASVFHAWGMTETNPFGGTGLLSARQQTLPPADRLSLKLGQGRAIFGLRRRIVDEDGRELPRDGVTPGRLQVRGNWVVDRYTNADAPIEAGWFDTGDIAVIDGEGAMRIVDRAKDLIKSGGEWISSMMLEDVAYAIPGVRQAAAIGIPNATWGERPALVIVAASDATDIPHRILAHMRDVLPRWQVPDAVQMVDTMPVTATGKVDKKLLREQLAQSSCDL